MYIEQYPMPNLTFRRDWHPVAKLRQLSFSIIPEKVVPKKRNGWSVMRIDFDVCRWASKTTEFLETASSQARLFPQWLYNRL